MTKIVLYLYYSFIYMSGGAFVSYISLYFDSIGLDTAQIGIITSASAVIALAAQPFWGLFTDRSTYKNHVLVPCLFFTAAGIWLIPLSGNSILLLTVAAAVFYLFQSCINPMSDAITLELAARDGMSFSRIRTVGSLGYAITAAAAGKLFSKDINFIFPVFSILILAAFLLSFLIPKVEGHQSGKKKVNLLLLFKDRRLVLLYSFSLAIQITAGFFYTFHSVYSRQEGISTGAIGIGVMIGSFSQFPFMLLFDRIFKRFSINTILAFSGLASAVRWLLYAVALTPATLYLIWVLHGFTYIVFYLCLAEYVSRNVIKELKASGQAVNHLILSGIGRIVGSSVGGVVSAAISIKYTFLLNSFICFAALIVFIYLSRRMQGSQFISHGESGGE